MGFKRLEELEAELPSYGKKDYKDRYLADIGMLNMELANYEFYMGGEVEKLFERSGDYEWLEDNHNFIQWMFPNHFESSINLDTLPMGYLEVQLFRNTKALGQKLLRSINIFLDFMGVHLDGQGTMSIASKDRLRSALLVNTHNHLRIRRLMACTSICGFRGICT